MLQCSTSLCKVNLFILYLNSESFFAYLFDIFILQHHASVQQVGSSAKTSTVLMLTSCVMVAMIVVTIQMSLTVVC